MSEVAQSCLTLCDPINCGLPGSSMEENLAMEFSRPEYWSGLRFPSPGDLPSSGIEPGSTCIGDRFFTIRVIREAPFNVYVKVSSLLLPSVSVLVHNDTRPLTALMVLIATTTVKCSHYFVLRVFGHLL